MIAPSPYGPRAARPALLPPTWPPFDPETGEFDLTDQAGPPDGFFVDPDIAMRMAEATAVTKELSPAEAWRDSTANAPNSPARNGTRRAPAGLRGGAGLFVRKSRGGQRTRVRRALAGGHRESEPVHR